MWWRIFPYAPWNHGKEAARAVYDPNMEEGDHPPCTTTDFSGGGRVGTPPCARFATRRRRGVLTDRAKRKLQKKSLAEPRETVAKP